MKTILASVAVATTAVAALTVTTSPAHAIDEEHCVSTGELNHLREGRTRREVEKQWDVIGRSKWVSERSTPNADAYRYHRCGDHADDPLFVTYQRGSRIWIQIDTYTD